MANNYVYFILDTETDLIKIGRSFNPEKRLQSLKNQRQRQLRILATIPAHDTEKELHRIFEKQRVKGEWFRRSRDLTRLIYMVQGRPDLLEQQLANSGLAGAELVVNTRYQWQLWAVGLYYQRQYWKELIRLWASHARAIILAHVAGAAALGKYQQISTVASSNSPTSDPWVP